MKKIGIAGLKSDWHEVIDTIQDAGMVEIQPIETDIEEASEEKAVLTNLRNGLDFLKKHIDKPLPRLELSQQELSKLVEEYKLNEYLDQLAREKDFLLNLESERKNKLSSLSELEPWLTLKYPLKSIENTEHTRTLLGMVPTAFVQSFRNEIKEKEGYCHIEEVLTTSRVFYLLLVYHVSEQAFFVGSLNKHEFSRWNPEKYNGIPLEEYHKLQEEISDIDSKIEGQKQKIRELTSELPRLGAILDYYSLLSQQRELRNKVATTSSAFFIEGWIQENKLGDLRNAIAEKVDAIDIIDVPLEKDEIPPVALKNNPLVEPFEVVTDLYGRPARGFPDPTPLLTPFFPIFFALCLTDAGYGFIVTLVGAILKFKYRKANEGVRKFITFIIILGIATMIIGALAGGYFGIDPSSLSQDNPLVKFATSIKLFDPLKDAIVFFAIAIICGIVQVSVGFIINGINRFGLSENIFLKIRSLVVSASWFCVTVGLGIFVLSNLIPTAVEPLMNPALMMLKYGLVGIVAGSIVFGLLGKQGFFPSLGAALGFDGIYGVVNLFGDILSYSRILALGLSTGVIAGVINIIAGNVAQVPIVGIIFAGLLVIVGHIGYTAISSLGAFVHPARLQFVEYFSKFYEAGGKPFQPFKKHYPNINLK
ncbi:V-type ATP synthase subunit I [bacterium]|nr:V-type ATP synthase subunit I [bacterium]